MLHFDPSEISNWASQPDAPHQLPKLIRRLILSTTTPTRLDIPGGSAVWRSGWDGLAAIETGNPWAPEGVSAWEFSCQGNITTKANSDYRKRTANPQGVAPAAATFVFVTLRQWSGKQDWLKRHWDTGEWAGVRAFDAGDIAAWLEQAPEVSAWFARLIGKPHAGGYTTLADWWQNWAAVSKPSIHPQLVLAGRQENADQVSEWVQQQPAHCYVQGQTREEAIAFVAVSALNSDAPWAAALRAKALVVKSEDAWHSLTNHKFPLILIRAFDGNASPQVAVNRGHHVITPLYAGEEPRGNGMTLPRLGRDETVAALAEMGLSETRARALARKTARKMPTIRRFLIDEAGGPIPAWASVDIHSPLPYLILIGQWDESNENDKAFVAGLARLEYEEIARAATGMVQTEDSPLAKVGSRWRFLSHEEAWHLLAPHLTPVAVARFQEMATRMLSIESPEFEMPVGERHLAGIHGKVIPHSRLLREGIARTLALMGNQGDRAKTVPNASYVPERVLRTVFAENTGWKIWATLGNILPTLAEAAPEAVLSAIEQRTAANPKHFEPLFAQQVHTGLIRTLGKLAWDPKHFARVAAVFIQLAMIDPGGNVIPRPAQSLTEMFLPGLRVSDTLDADRLETLETLLNRYPGPSWQAIVSSLQSRPPPVVVGRTPPESIPWTVDGATLSAWKDCKIFVDGMEQLLLEHVGHDAGRWQDVVGIISCLTSDAYQSATDLMIHRLDAIKSHPGAVALWTQLRQELHQHRTYTDANWAMPAAELEPLAVIYERLTPDDPVQAYSWLFDEYPKPPEGTARGDSAAHSAKIDVARQSAIAAVYENGGDSAVRSLAEAAPVPAEVGRAFVIGVGTEPALMLAVKHAGSDDRILAEMARGALWTIYRQSGWDGLEDAIARLKAANAPPQALAAAFLVAPATPDTWQRLANEEPAAERCYWERLNFYQVPEEDEDAFRFAAERLLYVNRSPSVAQRIAYAPVHPEIILQTLEQLPSDLAAGKETEPNVSSIHAVAKLLESLDESGAVGDDVIARLELPFLSALQYGDRPSLALYRVISSEPALFADLVASAYKRDDGQTDAMYDEQAVSISSGVIAHIIMGKGEIPGKTKDGTVDYESLSAWVKAARRLCAERSRASIGDHYIGCLLAKSPDGEDGLWPCEPVRELLESLLPTGAQRIEGGFVSGRHNLRGVTSRAAFAGGDQERALADKYRQHAGMMNSKWPHTAMLLRRIADDYQREAQWHDQKSDEMDQFGF